MRFRTCSGVLLLLLLSACATTKQSPKAPAVRNPRIANLQRAATLPWRDQGRCVVREASQPWPVLVEQCFHALDQERVRFHDTTGRCAVASAGAAAVGLGACVLAAPEIVIGAVVVIGIVVVAVAIQEELEAYELRRGRPEVSPMPETRPVPVARPVPEEPQAKQRPQPEPEGQDWPPPVGPKPPARERPRKCEPIPVPHLGGDEAHNQCADRFPPNRYPGNDVLVDDKRYDALQVGAPVLWEIKTDQFDTYSDFLQREVAKRQAPEMREERERAVACGYGFVVGVSTEAHKAALLQRDDSLEIIVTGCKR